MTSKYLAASFTPASVCVALLLALTPASAEKVRIQAGLLECLGDGGWGAIITSRKEFRCVFIDAGGKRIGRYKAVVHKFGLDIGATGKTAMQWAVLGPAHKTGRNYVPGSLQGEYAGVGAEAAVGVGLGANAMLGGGMDSFALQPVSVQAETGISIAAGVQTMRLTYIGPDSQ